MKALLPPPFAKGLTVIYKGNREMFEDAGGKKPLLKRDMKFKIIETHLPEKGLGKIGVDDEGEDIIIPDRDGMSIYKNARGDKRIIHAKDKAEWEIDIEEGKYAMCWYFKIPHNYKEGLELYFCKVLKRGWNYSTCELYYGEEFDPTKIKGTFTDVCTSDIRPFEK